MGSVYITVGQYLSRLYTLSSTTGAAPVIAIDWDDGNVQKVTLGHTGTATITLSNGIPGGRYTLIVCQDGAGGRDISYTISGVKWPSGSTPTPVTTASKKDLFSFICYATGSYIATETQNF